MTVDGFSECTEDACGGSANDNVNGTCNAGAEGNSCVPCPSATELCFTGQCVEQPVMWQHSLLEQVCIPVFIAVGHIGIAIFHTEIDKDPFKVGIAAR